MVCRADVHVVSTERSYDILMGKEVARAKAVMWVLSVGRNMMKAWGYTVGYTVILSLPVSKLMYRPKKPMKAYRLGFQAFRVQYRPREPCQ